MQCAYATAGTATSDTAPISCNKPVFEDDFSAPALNLQAWTIVQGKQGQSSSARTADMEVYKAQAITTDRKGLHINLSRNASFESGALPYTSGRIVSRQAFLYGYFEFSARIPKGRGLWPALWLRTPPGPPLNGEIDVLEGYGSHPSMIQSTLHPWKNGVEDRYYCSFLSTGITPQLVSSSCEHSIHPLPNDLSQEFHTYAVSWTHKAITWTFDGQPYFSVNSDIPTNPMVIVMNLQVNASHDGFPDPSLVLPQSLDVRHVRVCKL